MMTYNIYPDGKYRVLKTEEWEKYREDVSISMDPDYIMPDDPPFLDDCVVIRRQDVFAAPALDAYANAITVAISVMEASYGPEDIQPNNIQSLRNLADFFHEEAEKAWHENGKKLPD
jgi:hypothetical protein